MAHPGTWPVPMQNLLAYTVATRARRHRHLRRTETSWSPLKLRDCPQCLIWHVHPGGPVVYNLPLRLTTNTFQLLQIQLLKDPAGRDLDEVALLRQALAPSLCLLLCPVGIDGVGQDVVYEVNWCQQVGRRESPRRSWCFWGPPDRRPAHKMGPPVRERLIFFAPYMLPGHRPDQLPTWSTGDMEIRSSAPVGLRSWSTTPCMPT